MKRGAIVAGLAVVFMVGCATKVNLGNVPLFAQGGNQMTILAFDANTGAGITGAAMTMKIGKHTLTASVSGTAYIFENVPEGTFPIYVTANGYLDFVGQTIEDDLDGDDPADPLYLTYELAMYPAGSAPNDLAVKVFDSAKGIPVKGGKLVLTLKPTAATMFNQTAGLAATDPSTAFPNQLTGQWGYKPVVVVMDLTNGVATVQKSQMIQGVYTLQVYAAMNDQDQYLAPNLPATPADALTFNTMTDYPVVEIFMGTPAELPTVLNVSNEKPNTKAVNPTIIIKVAQPIELCNDPAQLFFYGICPFGNAAVGIPGGGNFSLSFPVNPGHTDCDLGAGPDDGGSNTGTTPATNSKVPTMLAGTTPNVTFGTGDPLQLTLTAVLDPAAANSDPTDHLAVEFQGIMVQVKGTTNCVPLAQLCLRDGGTWDGADSRCEDAAGNPTGAELSLRTIVQDPTP